MTSNYNEPDEVEQEEDEQQSREDAREAWLEMKGQIANDDKLLNKSKD